MGTYVLLTKLTPDVTRDIKDRERIGRKWMDTVHRTCPEVKWSAHYALLGPYDVMDIFEAGYRNPASSTRESQRAASSRASLLGAVTR